MPITLLRAVQCNLCIMDTLGPFISVLIKKLHKKISDSLRAKIAHYALQNGNAAAVGKFSKVFDAPLNEIIVRSLKKSLRSQKEKDR